jgi:hypothetical protein
MKKTRSKKSRDTIALTSDLARVPHALDLSSPNMAASVNAALKPLETLSKIVNQPSRHGGEQQTVTDF